MPIYMHVRQKSKKYSSVVDAFFKIFSLKIELNIKCLKNTFEDYLEQKLK